MATHIKPFPTSPVVTVKLVNGRINVYPGNVQRSQEGLPCFHYSVGESLRILYDRVPERYRTMLEDGFTLVVDRSVV